MRTRLLAIAIMAALIVAPTDLTCGLACLSDVDTDAQAQQPTHAHHHAVSDVAGTSWQAASQACDHVSDSEFVLATSAKAGTSLIPAPAALRIIHVTPFNPVVLSSLGGPRGRAAPPGITPTLPHLRI